ncbi:MAG: hypothetical protein JSV83_15375 [Desulfobacterales bacterium]|nr:MAG: hypothetical protein JSV83_15375 [Desulfobacterales bacterium]
MAKMSCTKNENNDSPEKNSLSWSNCNLPDFDKIRTIYDQTSAMHQGIADFRAKLLAILPIASGTGIFLLLGKGISVDKYPFFIAIGLFGLVVTLGLCIHELNGIYKCLRLQDIARMQEELIFSYWKFPKDKDDNMPEKFCEKLIGPFNTISSSQNAGDISGKKSFVFKIGVRQASMIVYSSVMAAWSYIAGVGLAYSIRPIINYDWQFPSKEIDLLSLNSAGLLAAIIVFILSISLWWRHAYPE